MTLRLDHIGLICRDLDIGASRFHEATGIALGPGGTHPKMATHNRLLPTGAGQYLELIAPDPAAPRPERPRWFGLDSPNREHPHLAFWMARTSDLDTTIAIAAEEGIDLGAPIPMSRGALTWRLSIPASGALPFGGAAPIFIEWPPGVHPTATMEDAGVRLTRLEITHPDAERIAALVERLGGPADNIGVTTGAFGLRAVLTFQGRAIMVSDEGIEVGT